jgi:citrate synthase
MEVAMPPSAYLTAQEAAAELGVTPATLYSYVSRGLIRSEAVDEAKRVRRYWREDIEKLKMRKEQRRNPAKLVETALHWGAPLLESAITLIQDSQLYYRGYDVLYLIANHTVEEVAALIWAGDLKARVPGLHDLPQPPTSARLLAILPQLAGLPLVERFQTLLPLAEAGDLAAYDLRPAAVAQTGARILRLLVATAAGDLAVEGTIAGGLQQSWAPEEPQAAELIKAALILCADHELNVSSFTAHCVASAGATPYQAVIAGLAALQGVKHGRSTERVEVFLKEIDDPARIRQALAGRLKRGETVPGFGHPLYPEGDPRAKALLERIAAIYPESAVVKLAGEVAAEALNLIGEAPNIDFGLVILAQTLKLPPGGPIALFALGRMIGWIGHAIEQYQLDRIIRPRAKYVGPPPVKDFERQGGS